MERPGRRGRRSGSTPPGALEEQDWEQRGESREALSTVLYLGGHRTRFPGVPQGLEHFI